MVNLREKGWIIPLSAGIIALLLACIPFGIYYNFETNRSGVYWYFGLFASFNNGVMGENGFLDYNEYVVVGSMFFIILLIIGIFFVLSALMTMKGKDVPHKGLIWTIFGIFLLLFPILYQGSFLAMDAILDHEMVELFSFTFDLRTLFPIVGVIAIVSGVKELAK